jgi:hypothetical protein
VLNEIICILAAKVPQPTTRFTMNFTLVFKSLPDTCGYPPHPKKKKKKEKLKTRGSVISMLISVKQNTQQQSLRHFLELCDTVLDEAKINTYSIIYTFRHIMIHLHNTGIITRQPH